MWDFLVRQILRQALKEGAKQSLNIVADPLNEAEAYIDRMKRDFHIDDYYKALELYNSDQAYWQQYYRPLPSPDPARERIRDSAAMAGVPSRYNVWEYDYPDDSTSSVVPQRPSNVPTPPVGKRSEAPAGVAPTAFAATDVPNAPSQTRFLVGRTSDPSQGSPFAVQPTPLQTLPDGSLSLNDAYLEYLKRLNAD